MYAAKKHVDRRLDVQRSLQFLGSIGPSIYLAHYIQQPERKVVVKVIPFHTDNPQVMAGQEAVLRKVFAGSIYYLKP